MSADSETPKDDSPAAEAPAEAQAPASEPEAEAPAGEPEAEAPASDAVGSAVEAPAASKDKSATSSLILIFLTVAMVAAVVVLLPRKVDLIVDNGLGFPVRIFVNGEDRGPIESHTSRTLSSVPAGKVVLTGHQLGPEGQKGRDLETLEGELSAPLFRQRRRAYVWNIEGKTDGYWILTKGYGDQANKQFKPEAYVPPGALFVIPGRCEPMLNDVPHQVRVKAGAKGTTRDVLFSNHRIQRELREAAARKQLGGMPPPKMLQRD